MSDPKKPEQPASITVTIAELNQLIASKVAEFIGKPYDEKIQEELDRQRGKDRPLPPEELVSCRSPSTGATFTARLILSRQFPSGRICELLDYERPEGTDKHVDDGGKYQGLREDLELPPLSGNLNAAQYRYRKWLYDSYFAADWNTLSGKPGSFLAQWRVAAPSKAAE